MHINYIANGMGSQSMYLLHLAAEHRIPATMSLTADTGWENDCDLNDGTKTTAKDFFHEHIKPFAAKHGIEAYFIKANDKNGDALVPLPAFVADCSSRDKAPPIPLFGSQKGRLMQSCTDKWKIRAMKQHLRVLGATSARSAQGIHWDERARRVKGTYIGEENGFSIYRSSYVTKDGDIVETKWLTHYYPLVDLKMGREDTRRELDRLGIPYLISSECAGCPHADPWRWMRRTPKTIENLSILEKSFNGEYFFTPERRPLKNVIAEYRQIQESQGGLFDVADFSCTNGVCGT